MLLLINWFRFLGIWRELKSILRNLDSLPLRAAFSRLPKQSSSPIWGWRVAHKEFLPVTEAIENIEALVRVDETAISHAALSRFKAVLRTYEEVEAKLERRPSHKATSQMITETRELALRAVVGGTTAAPPASTVSSLKNVVDSPTPPTEMKARSWGKRLEDLRASAERKKSLQPVRDAMSKLMHELQEYLAVYWSRGSAPGSSQRLSEPNDCRFVLAENIVAIRFYNYIRYVITEMRHVLFFMGIAISLLFISMHTYAFRAGDSADTFFLFLFFFLGGGVIWVLAQMERDPLLRRLQDPEHGGDPSSGSLGKNFYLNAARYGIIPLLTIVSSQVPLISNLLMGWFQPSLEVLR